MIGSRSLQDLLPNVRGLAVHFIALAEMKMSDQLLVPVKVKVTSTYRDEEYQDELYAQGRTKPGKIVTNSRGGDSIHQYRCAFDVALEIDGKITWDKSYYKILGQIGKDLGLTWGGDWDGDGVEDKNDWDLCHFQHTGGLTIAELKQAKERIA